MRFKLRKTVEFISVKKRICNLQQFEDRFSQHVGVIISCHVEDFMGMQWQIKANARPVRFLFHEIKDDIATQLYKS